ncbi:hypothetical protein DICVIV_04786 [Dictyocaulus viviparus]|uniref:Uncharacterized protein n=1 Tax=Dictyocaulus viviparus TaxID=29172 RepID=A0A0D8XZ86_DICVI|nr:hypothetical protein DICVIV_04786 [Dictyocaulus viviparus]
MLGVSRITQIDLHLFLKPAFIDREGIFETLEHHQSQPAYMVLGITPSCWVYFGWLHLILKVHDPLVLGNSEGRCIGYIPFIVRAFRVTPADRLIGLYCQFILSFNLFLHFFLDCSLNKLHTRGSRSDTFLIPFKAKARHRQFFSQEFPPGVCHRGIFLNRFYSKIYKCYTYRFHNYFYSSKDEGIGFVHVED